MNTGPAWSSVLSWWLLILGSIGWLLLGSLPSTPALRLRSVFLSRGTRSGRPLNRARSALGSLRHRWDFALGRIQNRRRRATIDLCRALAAELRGGRSPTEAMRSAATGLEPTAVAELARVTTVAHAGGDLAPALRRVAARPGAEGLGYLAACLQVASGTGAGLADVVDRLAESLAHDDAHRQEVVAQLAGPRTTAVLLSVLPVFGLALATTLGNGPLLFLLSTPAGLACLLLGLGLDALGLWWAHRMAGRVLATVEPG